MTAMAMTACTGQKAEKAEATQDNFNYVVDQFADLQILRYRVPGFESLSLKQKQLLYHLSEAALMDTTPLDGQSTVSFDAPSDVHPVTVSGVSGNGLYASDSRFTCSPAFAAASGVAPDTVSTRCAAAGAAKLVI